MPAVKNAIKIMHWNANSIQNKTEELVHFLQEHDIDVALISETHLKPCNKFKVQNYSVYRTDRMRGPGGGTAILVKKLTQHYALPQMETEQTETTGIQLSTTEGNINIHAIYIPPGNDLPENDLQEIFRTDTPTVAAGDYNAKNTEWYSNVNNNRGQLLKKFIDLHQLDVLSSDEATHIDAAHQSTDVLDIAVVKNVTWHTETQVITELSSDHLPVILEIRLHATEKKQTIEVTNWSKYKNAITTEPLEINNKNDIDKAVLTLEENIRTALQESTTQKTVADIQSIPVYLRNLIKQKNRAKRDYIRTLDPQRKHRLNQLTNEVQQQLKEHRNQQWEKKINSLTTEDRSLWKMVRALKSNGRVQIMPAIHDDVSTAITDEEKATIFSQMLENQYTPNPAATDTNEEYISKEVNNYIETAPIENGESPNKVEAEEIAALIKALPTHKAPGKDKVTNNALKHLPQEIHVTIANIANAVMTHQYFPQRWKTAQTVMIHKTEKSKKQASSYRPISLLSSISKLIERTIHERLKQKIEEMKILPDHQHGFRERHSTIHQLTRITEDIIRNFNKTTATGAIFLDVEKAFDKVWHNGLIYKLITLRIPTWMIKTIHSYLQNRRFEIKVGTKISQPKMVRAGVPQGSILGPTLFNLYMADMPKLEKCKIAQFADDTAIYLHHRRASALGKQLQADLVKLSNWFKKWRVKINPNKTTAILFSKKFKKPPPKIKIDNVEINWGKEVRYLGLTLDRKMTFKPHITNTAKKSRQLMKALYPLLCRRSKLDTSNKITIVKSIILPSLMYGCEIWNLSNTTNQEKLQRILNIALRMAVSAPWYITNEQIRTETNMKNIEKITEERTKNLITKMKTHTNQLIKETTNTAPTKTTDSHIGIINKQRHRQNTQ